VFVGGIRDVDDRDVRLVRANARQEVLGRARVADDMEARVLQQTRDAFPRRSTESSAIATRVPPVLRCAARSGGNAWSSPGATSWKSCSSAGRPGSSCSPRSIVSTLAAPSESLRT
jgi:hypothetical protein